MIIEYFTVIISVFLTIIGLHLSYSLYKTANKAKKPKNKLQMLKAKKLHLDSYYDNYLHLQNKARENQVKIWIGKEPDFIKDINDSVMEETLKSFSEFNSIDMQLINKLLKANAKVITQTLKNDERVYPYDAVNKYVEVTPKLFSQNI